MIIHSKLPVGTWAQIIIELLNQAIGKELHSSSASISTTISELNQFLIRVPQIVLIVIFTILGLISTKNWKSTLFCLIGPLIISNLGYWEETIETLSFILFSLFFSVTLGVPIGILMTRYPKLASWIHPILDLMQTIPTFVYLIPTLMLFGLGLTPGVISTVVFSMPAMIKMTHLGLTSVPNHLIELGHAFGGSRLHRLLSIELPYAMPTLLAGISQCVMLSLSMVVIAALVGADGLGKPVIQALNTVNIAKGFESGLSIVILAIILDTILSRRNQQGSLTRGRT